VQREIVTVTWHSARALGGVLSPWAALLVVASPASSASLSVPSPLYPTIAAAIDSARAGDVISLAPGSYTGAGNRDLDYQGKAITIESQAGPEATRIDCEGQGRAFIFHHGEQQSSILRGVTICNGRSDGNGGGVLCLGATPSLERVAIVGCFAHTGGGLATFSGNPMLSRCTIAANRAQAGGGGVEVWSNGALQFRDCVVWGNCSPDGSDLRNHGTVALNCTVLRASEMSGDGLLFWNDGGWIEDDPRFCDPQPCESAPSCRGSYGIGDGSSCLPDGNACGRAIGALELECAQPTAIAPTTWGAIKARYESR